MLIYKAFAFSLCGLANSIQSRLLASLVLVRQGLTSSLARRSKSGSSVKEKFSEV